MQVLIDQKMICQLSLTRLSAGLSQITLFRIALIELLFPTFDLPIKANSAISGFGHELTSGLLFANSADLMITS